MWGRGEKDKCFLIRSFCADCVLFSVTQWFSDSSEYKSVTFMNR